MSLDPTAPTGSSRGHGDSHPAIGGYNLERVIGSGGMGVVWAASDARGRPVAVKLLRASGSAEAKEDLRARLRRVQNVAHEHVARMLEVGTEGGRDFVVMERVEGQSAADWLALQPAHAEIVQTLLAAGRGLAAAHQAGVLHRNFTLSSVLRGKDGRIAVTDFGAATGSLDPSAERTTSSVGVATGRGEGPAGDRPPRQQDALLDAALSQAGVFVGTPGYMAPEQLVGAPASDRGDQFSYCVAFWEAWTGQRPFVAGSLDELERVMRKGAPAAPADMPAPLHRALARGLAPDPSKRWPTLGDLLDELGRAAGPRGARSANLALWAGAAVAVACLVTLLALLRC